MALITPKNIATSKLTDGSNFLTSASITNSDLPSGSVIQTVTSDLDTSNIGTSSDSNVATGLTLAITPKAAGSSFILTMGSGQQTYGTGGLNMVAILYRSNPTGSTPSQIDYFGAIRQNSTYNGTWSCQYTHSAPSYTLGQEVTYHVYFRSRGAGGTVYFQYSTGGLASHVRLRCDEIKA